MLIPRRFFLTCFILASVFVRAEDEKLPELGCSGISVCIRATAVRMD